MASTETDTYLQQIHAARTRIQECFKHAHVLLTIRETDLLTELQNIQINYEADATRHHEELQELEQSKDHLMSHLRDNETLNKALDALNDKIKRTLKIFSQARTICFQWNTDFEVDIQHAGEIITTTTVHKSNNTTSVIIPDYMNKSMPVISCCKHKDTKSNISGDLYHPRGLAIEPQTGIIYVADGDNNRTQAFAPDGEFCFMFNERMNKPWGLCIYDNTVYVSQNNGHCITFYQLNGTFLNTVGTEGNGESQFNHPTGIAASSNGYIYVCDCSNHRLQIFDQKLNFHLMFGNGNVKYPDDVKLTAELIIVLDQSDPCIHLFTSSDHSLVKSIIGRGEGKQLSYPPFISIDAEVNIIITDRKKNRVKVFTKSGECIYQFGKEGHSPGEFIYPTGVAIDSLNRLVVVSRNTNHALQIF